MSGPRPGPWQSRQPRRRSSHHGWRRLRALKPSGPWQVRQGGRFSRGCTTTGGRIAMAVCGSWHWRQAGRNARPARSAANVPPAARPRWTWQRTHTSSVGTATVSRGSRAVRAGQRVLQQCAVAALAADAGVASGSKLRGLGGMTGDADAAVRVRGIEGRPGPGVRVAVEAEVQVRRPGHHGSGEQHRRERGRPGDHRRRAQQGSAARPRPDAVPEAARARQRAHRFAGLRSPRRIVNRSSSTRSCRSSFSIMVARW